VTGPGADLVTSLRQAGVARGDLVGLVVSPALGIGLATAEGAWAVAAGTAAGAGVASGAAASDAVTAHGLAPGLQRADEALRPR
jgi:hypothetical protein